MEHIIGQEIGRYQIISNLGLGGMAVVYKAYDERLDRIVALKVIRTETIPQEQQKRLMARFDREAKTQAMLNHRHIVPVFDYGFYEGSPYLVMGYVPGETLKERAVEKVSWEQAVRWLVPIADALSYAHNRGVVHRDVKPSNILFDERNQPVLTDFGIVKMLGTDEEKLTGTGLGVGTPGYMAPEQWRGKTSPHTDQYALGVILYELVTGEKPYQGATPAAIAIKQATKPVRDPRENEPDIPGGVAKIIMKMLARQPQDRYENMDALAGALKEQISESSELIFETGKEEQQKRSRPKLSAISAEQKSEAVTFDEFEINRNLNQEKKLGLGISKQSKNDPKKRTIPAWLMWVVGSVIMISMLGIMLGTLFSGSGRSAVFGGDNRKPTDNVLDEGEMDVRDSDGMDSTSLTPIGRDNESDVIGANDFELGIGSKLINEIDGAVVVHVPGGEFLMGSEDVDARENEKPAHLVLLDSFWIYQTEVTNEQYRQCILSGACRGSLDFYLDNNYPAVLIHWEQASEYCNWADARLPTEAEWEKAARGSDGRNYPWGDDVPNCSLANFRENNLDYCVDGIQEVGSYPFGASPYGVFDMVGSVSEWVSDWYVADYFSRSPYENPTGPTSGEHRVVRGGNWQMPEWHQRVTYRGPGIGPSELIGFRCVLTEIP